MTDISTVRYAEALASAEAEIARLRAEVAPPAAEGKVERSKLWWMLHIIDKMGGSTDASDGNWLDAFCNDGDEPDTFNRASKAGYLRTTFHSDFDTSSAYLTDAGRAFLAGHAPPAPPAGETQAARDVLAERERQKTVEGWTVGHDDAHRDGSLAVAAVCYAGHRLRRIEGSVLDWWPWTRTWWKPKDYRYDLVRAGALILAEIERLDRDAAAQEPAR